MAERLFEELGLNKREAKEVVEQFFEEIRLSLERNEQVCTSALHSDLMWHQLIQTIKNQWDFVLV